MPKIKTYKLDKDEVLRLMKIKKFRGVTALERATGCGNGTIGRPLRDGTGVGLKTLSALACVLCVNTDQIVVKEPVTKESDQEEAKPDGAFLQRQLTLRELKLQTELLQKIYDLLK